MTIKQSPDDFVVEERLDRAFADRILPDPRPCAVYRLTKTGMTSPAALRALTDALRTGPGLAALAGLKDKHARTVQHVTVRGKNPPALPPRVAGPGWEAVRLGWTDWPIDSSAIEGNHFRLLVRGLTQPRCAQMDEAAALLSSTPGSLRVVNYFGDQRFGSARHGQGFVARHLVRGEFEAALRLSIATPARPDNRAQKAFKRAAAAGWGRWDELAKKLRRCPDRRAVEVLAGGGDFRAAFAALPYRFQQLCVFAYQSHLWNAMARRLIEARCAGGPGGRIVADDPFGQMIFPAAGAVPAELIGLILPVPGRGTIQAEPWREAADAVLAAEGLAGFRDLRIAGLRRPFFGQAERALFVEASSFHLGPPAENEGKFVRAVEFTLPRGAYATVVLRALGH